MCVDVWDALWFVFLEPWVRVSQCVVSCKVGMICKMIMTIYGKSCRITRRAEKAALLCVWPFGATGVEMVAAKADKLCLYASHVLVS